MQLGRERDRPQNKMLNIIVRKSITYKIKKYSTFIVFVLFYIKFGGDRNLTFNIN